MGKLKAKPLGGKLTSLWAFHWLLGNIFVKQTKPLKEWEGQRKGLEFAFQLSHRLAPWLVYHQALLLCLCERIPGSPAKIILSKNHLSTWLWQETCGERRLYLVKGVSKRLAKVWPQRINNCPDWLNPHQLFNVEEALGPLGFSVVTDGTLSLSFIIKPGELRGISQMNFWNPWHLESILFYRLKPTRSLPGRARGLSGKSFPCRFCPLVSWA